MPVVRLISAFPAIARLLVSCVTTAGYGGPAAGTTPARAGGAEPPAFRLPWGEIRSRSGQRPHPVAVEGAGRRPALRRRPDRPRRFAGYRSRWATDSGAGNAVGPLTVREPAEHQRRHLARPDAAGPRPSVPAPACPVEHRASRAGLRSRSSPWYTGPGTPLTPAAAGSRGSLSWTVPPVTIARPSSRDLA